MSTPTPAGSAGPERPLAGRVALVTGANHGIGAATAVALARLGADVAVTYLRLDEADDDPGRPAAYGAQRSQTADPTVAAVEAAGARGHQVEADLADPEVPARLFDEVEKALGPVAILVNNASGWRKDTFARRRRPVRSADRARARRHLRRPVPRRCPRRRPAHRRAR